MNTVKSEELSEYIVKKLNKNFSKLKNDFSKVDNKTRFFYLDNLLDDLLTLEAFKQIPSKKFLKYTHTFRERKYTFKNIDQPDYSILSSITDAFQSQIVINVISKITGIDKLVADPSLYAGGVSRMDKDHFLNPHIDNSHNSSRTMYRRLNLLFYITPNITINDGGCLELWDDKVLFPFKIHAKFNRLVVMETNKKSWHSVEPVKANIKRCCISNYYFTKKSPENNRYYHVTSFSGRPNQRFIRTYCKFDNFIRNFIVKLTGMSRGTKLLRNNP